MDEVMKETLTLNITIKRKVEVKTRDSKDDKR